MFVLYVYCFRKKGLKKVKITRKSWNKWHLSRLQRCGSGPFFTRSDLEKNRIRIFFNVKQKIICLMTCKNKKNSNFAESIFYTVLFRNTWELQGVFLGTKDPDDPKRPDPIASGWSATLRFSKTVEKICKLNKILNRALAPPPPWTQAIHIINP